MSDFREELIEAMAQTWERDFYKRTIRERCVMMLDAALAHRPTVECPECGGTGATTLPQEGTAERLITRCPAGCINGRVPGDTRLAIVVPADRVGRLFLLAPDLPEGTQA